MLKEMFKETSKYLFSREHQLKDTIIKVGNVEIGGNKIVVMAGPCAVESEEQIVTIAQAVKNAGAVVLRGGAFKPRTDPYTFQGLGEKGLGLLSLAKKRTGLPIITEVMDAQDIELVAYFADILQIGSRNMQNYALLKALGRTRKPVMLKRGMAATIEEFLLAAEYILSSGNHNVMLCERGIKTFETATRFTFDINAISLLKQLSHLPVIADPSHGTGLRELVAPISKAAIAAGADGLLIEVHINPKEAKVDGRQSILPEQFSKLMEELRVLAKAVGREI